jgi:hypothetical protein
LDRPELLRQQNNLPKDWGCLRPVRPFTVPTDFPHIVGLLPPRHPA